MVVDKRLTRKCKEINFRYCQLVSESFLQLYNLLLGSAQLITARVFAACTLAYHVLSQIFEQRKRETVRSPD